MQHGKSWIIFAAFACLVLLYFFSNGGSGAKEQAKTNDSNDSSCPINLTGVENIPLEECKNRGLYDMAVVLESKDCAACNTIKPVLNELENETGVSFLYVDLSSSEGADWAEKHGLKVYPAPTVIINCEVLIGAHEKQEYLAALERAIGG